MAHNMADTQHLPQPISKSTSMPIIQQSNLSARYA